VTSGLAANGLVITSPTAGTVVAPGQLITVSVTVTGSYPKGVAIVGPGLTSEGFQTGANPTFTLAIPTNAYAGRFNISAVTSNSAGSLVASPQITLDVERPDSPQSLAIQPPDGRFDFVGDSVSLGEIRGNFADGSHLDLRLSSLLQVSTSNSAVAVFQRGQLIAAGPGSATVTFSVGTASQSIPVVVLNSARGDLNGDGRVDNSDVAIVQTALNTPATIVNDARDLNQDGQITSADVTLLKALCTTQKPLCATH
jgi:hypothetical protein